MMKCTACGAPMKYVEGENLEDFGCSNPNYCQIRIDRINYFPHLGVRNNWWFATQYHLPFYYNNQWICVEGPKNIDNKEYTVFGYIEPCVRILRLPYFALPANNDFEREFNILKKRFENLMVY